MLLIAGVVLAIAIVIGLSVKTFDSSELDARARDRQLVHDALAARMAKNYVKSCELYHEIIRQQVKIDMAETGTWKTLARKLVSRLSFTPSRKPHQFSSLSEQPIELTRRSVCPSADSRASCRPAVLRRDRQRFACAGSSKLRP